jgi:hypothetical protein
MPRNDGVHARMGAQAGQHVVAQRLWFEHQGVGSVAGDVTGQLVGGSDVEFDHLAVATAESARVDGPAGAS